MLTPGGSHHLESQEYHMSAGRLKHRDGTSSSPIETAVSCDRDRCLLVEEYGIPIGIHNHGPGHKYALMDTIAKSIKDHSPKIGCRIDTGRFLRSKERPWRFSASGSSGFI